MDTIIDWSSRTVLINSEFKHDVLGKRQAAIVASDFAFNL